MLLAWHGVGTRALENGIDIGIGIGIGFGISIGIGIDTTEHQSHFDTVCCESVTSKVRGCGSCGAVVGGRSLLTRQLSQLHILIE